MKPELIWYKTSLRDKLFTFEKGKKVLVAKSKLGLSLGNTWFIFDGKKMYHVADSYLGKDLKGLVSANRELYPEQNKVNRKFAPIFTRQLSNMYKTP